MIRSVIQVREKSLVGNLKVKRILPFRTQRMVGPFTFLDHMGPVDLPPGHDGDVPPHPHIGLSTVTYLFEGILLHRDSLGSVQTITPGDVNWMTAGRGIVHSERSPDDQRTGSCRFEGLQAWVALPVEDEEQEPRFEHYPKRDLPSFEVGGVRIHLLAGEAFGHRSPVKTHSPLFYFESRFQAGQKLSWTPPPGHEAAFYIVGGRLRAGGQVFEGPLLLVFERETPLELEAETDVHGFFLGGEPFAEARFIWWNFVSSSKERLESAKQAWKEQKFPKIPGETEFVPLPEDPASREKSTLP